MPGPAPLPPRHSLGPARRAEGRSKGSVDLAPRFLQNGEGDGVRDGYSALDDADLIRPGANGRRHDGPDPVHLPQRYARHQMGPDHQVAGMAQPVPEDLDCRVHRPAGGCHPVEVERESFREDVGNDRSAVDDGPLVGMVPPQEALGDLPEDFLVDVDLGVRPADDFVHVGLDAVDIQELVAAIRAEIFPQDFESDEIPVVGIFEPHVGDRRLADEIELGVGRADQRARRKGRAEDPRGHDGRFDRHPAPKAGAQRPGIADGLTARGGEGQPLHPGRGAVCQWAWKINPLWASKNDPPSH